MIFLNYFYDYWIAGPFRDLWNQYDNNLPRTNNFCEGYNNKLNSYIVSDKPNVYGLIISFKDLET